MVRGAFVVVLAIISPVIMSAVAAGADDFKPKVCATAVPYAGPPLHAPLPRGMLVGVEQSMAGELDVALQQQLNEAADWILKNTSAPGLTVAVGIPGQGMWFTARGLAVATPPTPLAAQARFHWASAGKMFTATVVMQLIEEGKLAYDDPLAKWFPDFPNAGAITIDHLLTHTNGIFSFNSDLKFQELRGYQAPEKLLKIAARHGCVCCPGERWYYSNTGYVLLGLIAEKIEGRPLHESVQARIIRPLGLTQTVAFTPGKPPQDLPIGHIAGKPDEKFEPTTPYGAGNIAASAHDMALFWQAVLAGKLLRPATVEQAYARLFPMFDPGTFYGRGVMLTEFTTKEGEKIAWLGHSGGTPGLKSVVAYDPQAKLFLAVALNGDVSAEATANKLRQVVTDYRAAQR